VQLPDFIVANIEPIQAEWVASARTGRPPERDTNTLELEDEAAQILAEIVEDMRRPQDGARRFARSQGRAMRCARRGSEMDPIVSEYRALRAVVMRLWSASPRDVHTHDLEDVMRFNEAVDKAIAVSLAVFAADADRARNLYLRVLGHDLREALETIVNCAQHELRIRPESARQTALTLNSAMKMKALVGDLLEATLHRPDAGISIEPSTVHLERFARDTLDELNALNPGRIVELDVKGNLQGTWDAHRLHQVLSNVVFNALKYGAPATPVRVTLDGTDADEVVLAVHNFGNAIPSEALQKIFDPFVRGRAQDLASHPSGANIALGLYVARAILTAHSGTISATSSAEDGTRFEIRLPRHSAAVV